MEYTVFYFLGSSLVPELRAYIAARASCDVHFVLVAVAAIGTLPHKLAVRFLYLYFAVEAANLAVIAFRVKLRIHDVVVYELDYRKHRLDIVLHIGDFDVAYRAARGK